MFRELACNNDAAVATVATSAPADCCAHAWGVAALINWGMLPGAPTAAVGKEREAQAVYLSAWHSGKKKKKKTTPTASESGSGP
jgi:hypothetical protein